MHGHMGFEAPWAVGWRFRGGRRARRGNVRAAILALLAERPMHGYEMIQELESRSGGIWRPSAGSIYPTLQLLQDEGLVTSEELDGKRVFSLTDAGRAEAPDPDSETPPWREAGEAAESPRLRLRAAVSQVAAAAMQVGMTGSEQQLAAALDVLADTRRRLYSLLADSP